MIWGILSAFGGEADSAQTLLNVRFWHKADMPTRLLSAVLTTSSLPV